MALLKEKENVLYVRMLGGFSLRWNGKLIAGGSKASDSQNASLLQILIHEKDKGVSRDKLEELLFSDRDMSNIHHALQSVIYNTKQKLLKAGLPADNCIEQTKGVFRWSNTIPTVVDAFTFEDLFHEAEQTKDLDERLSLYLQACYAYGGEFLMFQTGIVWIVREARRYKEMFCTAVERATELLRVSQDYFQMEDLGLYAARIDPLADWETITMEALVSLGRTEDARKLYDNTVQYYFNEQGLRPSKRLLEQFDRLGEKMQYRHAVLDQIQAELTGLNDKTIGGYLCNYPVFVGIYRMVERMLERGGQSVYIMLCTIVDSKGNPMREGEILDQLVGRMGDSIRRSIRRGDAMCRYGKGQYLVLLINTTRENCNVIQKRINSHFLVGRQRTGIEYYVNSVFWTPAE